ncbi:hypothetical protein BDV93DRAFT_333276 [Ceratobasidium sp. AG-I]|nr:hypothetical protein BDV93DRAFT_333276 [Ceratobasidium sp. AG-I]
MYPIRAIKITSLNNSKTATASITTSFQPRQWTSETIAGPKRLDDFCDCIEDYRSTTVFEVIGSVGGLFALLQSLHILLFGRPMLWGLTGAKLVTPFGLLGGCSSAGFKRRLRSEYHLQDSGSGRHPEDIAETIRIGAFLRDFVIDFGPADVPPVPVASSQTVAESEPLRTDQPPVSERSEMCV